MSKRNMVLLALAVLFMLSVTAFAALPVAQNSPAEGQAIAALQLSYDFEPDFDPPECPGPSSPGCS